MRRAAILMVAMAAVLETGCIVQITKVTDPKPLFEQARLEAGRYAGRPGRAHEVNVLVFEKDEGQLIRVSVPIWLVKKLEEHTDIDTGDADLDHVRRVVGRRLRVEDLEKAGLGTLIEVNEEDGEQVLVWLK
jgi:hypothetical protein